MSILAVACQPKIAIAAATLLRLGLIVFGTLQDQYSPVKYTDIDYYVFTDAARYVAQGRSPYLRDTYRYTPLLAWILVPTSWSSTWFVFGKVLFSMCDVVAGIMMITILKRSFKMTVQRATGYANIWLLNPMVAQISTRGSSEGLLLAFVVLLVWATSERKFTTAGLLLGFLVHLKIYPFIYACSIAIWLTGNLPESPRGMPLPEDGRPSSSHILWSWIKSLFILPVLQITCWSLLSFLGLNTVMYLSYGNHFLQQTFFYHLIRTDHRHNFSPYNILLYLTASPGDRAYFAFERFAFVPQLLISTILIPLRLSRQNLFGAMFAQTVSFVTFNKVCTSQYFLWYMVFLPFYLPSSSWMQHPAEGITVLILWILGQCFAPRPFAQTLCPNDSEKALWLSQGYRLEFLGETSFFPGLLGSSLLFFVVNVWILGSIISDIRRQGSKWR